MWATNDQEYRWVNTAWKFKAEPADRLEIYQAARRMQAEELAKLIGKPVHGIGWVVKALVAPYRLWREYQQAYYELSQLDDRMLADIGITRSDIPRVAAGLGVENRPVARALERTVKVPPSANTNRPQVAA